MVTTSPADQITRRLSGVIGSHKYDMWFAHTHMNVDGANLEVATDSAFVARWIDSHFSSQLRDAAMETLGHGAKILVSVRPELFDGASTGPLPAPRRPGEDQGRHPGSNGEEPRSRRAARTSTRTTRAALRRLDEYVVGRSNRLAFSAACQIAEESQAGLYSPLFIHGECGVGKTHLLQGITRRFSEVTGRPQSVRYVTGEQFTNEYIAAVRSNALDDFRRRTRKLDLLAIDDVHFLACKVRTQSEFMHTLDAIDLTGARVVLASDEHPRQIKRFSQGLISRFLSGMVVQVERPDRDTRVELTRRLTAQRGLRLSETALEELASRCVGSVRELEGAVIKLAAICSVSNHCGEIGMVLVEQLFRQHTRLPATPIRIEQIIDRVCRRLAVARTDLMGRGRHRRVVLARGLVAYLGRHLTTHSYPEIAAALGRINHSTVHTAAQRLTRQVAADERIQLDGDTLVQVKDLVDELRHEMMRSGSR